MTKYIYSATGEKLRTIYQTAVPNITVAMGSKRELTDAEVLYKDSVDYYHGGKLTVKNGRLDKCYFDGGYAQAYNAFLCVAKPSFIYDEEPTEEDFERFRKMMESWRRQIEEHNNTDAFSFHYYTADHLGNIREVINEDAAVEQTTNYYPFGTPFSEEAGNTNPDLQTHKYNGKEFDTMHGLNTYDYGARQYNSLLGRWDRMDKLAERDYATSPYAYCHNNPINKFDPDGNIDYFSNTGKYLYSKGSEPSMYVQRGNGFVNLSSLDLRNNANMQTAANIVGHYAREVGISYNQNGGTGTVGVSTMHRYGAEAEGPGVLAGTYQGDIYMKVVNGKMNDFMYNFYQLKGTLRHEKQHQEDQKNHKHYDDKNLRHAEIVGEEMSHQDFKKSTKEYQKAQAEQLNRYLNKVNDNDKNTDLYKKLKQLYYEYR